MEVNSRIGKKVSVYEMPEREAVDIDAASDWVLCEHELKKKTDYSSGRRIQRVRNGTYLSLSDTGI